MGGKVSKNNNIVINNQNNQADIIIEYEGYEEFAMAEIANNNTNKQDKIKPNPSLNNHSGGSYIGKYESEHDNKLRDRHKEDKKDNEEDNKLKSESKFHNTQNDENKKENEENNNVNENKDMNNNEVVDNKEKKKKVEESIKNENNNMTKENEKKEENNNIKEENGNENKEENKEKINNEENINKEENINNTNKEELNQNQKEENINNINNEKNIQQENIIENAENKENTNQNVNNNNENIEKNNINEEKNKNENNKNEEFAPKKIVLPDINTIISVKVLEEGAGNELLFMSNLNKMDHISIKERVKYSEKFCITTKDNFLIYETRENYIKVKKPLAIIPINSIKNVVLFKLTKKVINYDHFYIEFQLDENNRNNVYNQIETFYINDLDNNNNENKGDTALVLFKTEEKNLAKKWYVLLKFLAELKLKN